MDENVQREIVRALDLDNATHVGRYMLVSKAWSIFVKKAALEDILHPYHKVTQYVMLMTSPHHNRVSLYVTYPTTQRFVFGLRFTISRYAHPAGRVYDRVTITIAGAGGKSESSALPR